MDKRVLVITTGGTIASRHDTAINRTQVADDASELVAALSLQSLGCEVEVRNFAKVLSFNLQMEHVVSLAAELREVLAGDAVAGAVVTQGTDTLEESAYLLDLLVDGHKPIVVTGAQRPADHPQSDGPGNLADAIVAAADPALADCGVVICFNGQLHAARDVTKLHTSATETFTSLNHGHLGIVDDGHVVMYRTPRIRSHYTLEAITGRVPLVSVVMDSDSTMLDAAVNTGADGIVIEAFGRGNVGESLVSGIRRGVERGIPIVVTSRCPIGRVKPVYGTGGGGRELQEIGVIFAGDLKGPKVRILMLALLSAGLSPKQIRCELLKNAP